MSNPEIRAKITLATQYNAQLIKSIQQDYLGRVRLTTLQASMQGVRHESIISDIRSIGNVTESRARLIARDQTSKLNGALTEVRQTSLGVEEYIWSASGDERVREDHKNNDGKRFKWSEPPPTGHPSHDVNCRCVAIPVIDIEGYPQ